MGMFDLMEQAEKLGPMMEKFAAQYDVLCANVQKTMDTQVRIEAKLDKLLTLHKLEGTGNEIN